MIWQKINEILSIGKTTIFMTASDEAECLNGNIMGYLRNGKYLLF